MNLSEPLADISPSLHGRVLTALAETTKPLTGRQVAAKLSGKRRNDDGWHGGRSVSGTLRVLNLLVESGMVRRVDHPPSALYTLNRDHLAARHVVALTGLREELFDRLRELIAGWEIQPVSAVVFGSVARGESRSDSDVDLLFVRDVPSSDVWSAQLFDLERRVSGWTGNHVGSIEYHVREWDRSIEIEDPLVDEIVRDGVTVAGASPRLLLGHHREGMGSQP